VVGVLHESGVLPPPRALLDAPADAPSPLASIHAHLSMAGELDPGAHSTRLEELAYLANTLVAGCSLQDRPFTEREAADAAVAVCNLGLENWPRRWLTGAARVSGGRGSAAPLPGHL